MEKIQSRFHWGWRIGIIYTTFALSTIGFMIFSFTQKVDLVSPQYYADELRQDAKMLAENNALNLSEKHRLALMRAETIIRPHSVV